MDQNELMRYVVDALDRHQVPYAVTGSHASNVYGETIGLTSLIGPKSWD